MTYASFTELLAAVTELRDRKDLATALALVSEHRNAFGRHTAFVCLIEAELLAELGRTKESLDVLDRALAEGSRYKRTWLEANPHLAAMVGVPGFAELAARSQQRWDEAAAESKPSLTLLLPPNAAPVTGHPLLIVLHGNNATAAETVPFWSSAANRGWVTAVPQSGEAGATRGSLTWNDDVRAHKEIATHIAAIRREVHLNEDAIVLAGFSMGGSQAIAMVLRGKVRARGLVPIAAWLPHIREFAALAVDGWQRSGRRTWSLAPRIRATLVAKRWRRFCRPTAEKPTSTSARAWVTTTHQTCRPPSTARSPSSPRERARLTGGGRARSGPLASLAWRGRRASAAI